MGALRASDYSGGKIASDRNFVGFCKGIVMSSKYKISFSGCQSVTLAQSEAELLITQLQSALVADRLKNIERDVALANKKGFTDANGTSSCAFLTHKLIAVESIQ